MRENRPSGSEGGGAEANRLFLPLSVVSRTFVLTSPLRFSFFAAAANDVVSSFGNQPQSRLSSRR